MENSSANLAQFITKSRSKQSYLIARWLVDKDLVNDCLRAYAYFRWADDVVDINCRSSEERIAFIERQKTIIDASYLKKRPANLGQHEAMIADLIEHDKREDSGLQSFIRSFMAVLEFDTQRKGKLISLAELTWYSECLGKAVTDAIQYFIGNDCVYPEDERRYLAATAAHITHMLRDMSEDITEGFVNIPEEWLEAHSISLDANNVTLDVLKTRPFRAWVKSQVEQARAYFREGKAYLDSLPVLRCKIAGYWYCARFECVLDAIEHEGFVLRGAYQERKRFVHQLKLTWLTLSVAFHHLFRPVLSQTEVITHRSALDFPAIWTQKNATYDRHDPGISSAVAVNKYDQI